MYAFAFPLLLMMACTPPGDPADEAPAPRSDDPPAASAGQDSLIQARVGEEFTIELRSNATTGYRWMLADSLDAALVARVRDAYVADPAPEGIVGSGGREAWTFRAVAPGETAIHLRYARPWESPTSAATRAVFRVRIHPAAR